MIDLRSDTVTAPTDGMRKAMHEAEVGDDVFGEDPSVVAFEERVAELLGHEAGLFTVTGSLANILGVRSLVPQGGELLCEARAHVVRAELGAHAVLGGVTTRTWAHPKGHVDFAALDDLLEPNAGPYFVSTAAVAVENTHNFAGGTVQPLDSLVKLCRRLDGTGVGLHLDGARIWNAHVASGVPLDAYGRLFDTVSVCFSKGLGAPVGSMLLGSAERIAAARVWRKRMGAGWRQAGVLAAAASYAVDHHLHRLSDDHASARAIAQLVADAAPGVVDPAAVETNIVVLDLGGRGVTAGELVAVLKQHGVLAGAVGGRFVRLVTHLDLSAADCRAAGETVARLLAHDREGSRPMGGRRSRSCGCSGGATGTPAASPPAGGGDGRSSTRYMAANTSAPPMSVRTPSCSSLSATANAAANTGSIVMMIAARVAVMCACAHVCRTSAIAPDTSAM